MKIHHPTPDESTWAWWCLMWSIKDISFEPKSGAHGGHATDKPGDYLKRNSKGYIGRVVHQNSCGHGYTPRDSFRFAEYTKSHSSIGADGYATFAYAHDASATLLGASPSETMFRGYPDRQKRWSKN